MSEKYRLCIPYRNRQKNLDKLLPILEEYFKDNDYIINIVEQDDGELFNLGTLTNIGFNLFNNFESDLNWTYIYQPVDCYPLSVNYNIEDFGIRGLRYAGNTWDKAFVYSPSEYIRINGYSNDMYGWGGEDQELRRKVEMFGVKYDSLEYEWISNEDISNFNANTNQTNMNKAFSRTTRQFLDEGLNTLKYCVKDVKCIASGVCHWKVRINELCN